MKKLWTLLAAVFCFAACEDNLGDAQQGTQDPDSVIVNVSATSAFGYQWQAGDNVKFVFNADSTKTFAVVASEETTVASISYDENELEGVVMDENVYVVFPASVETKMEDVTVGGGIESKLHMTYSLSATQDGVITSEENLSYAVIPAEELDGEASVAAQLRSPFAILDVTLPQGVKSVTFTADNMYGSPLAADVTVTVGADAVSAFSEKKNSSKVVTVENPAGLPASTKVLVIPGNTKPLAVKMDGLDGAMYKTSVLAETTLEAGKVYSVNLTSDNVFSINYSIDGGEAAALGQTVAISPLGANMTVSVVSLHEGQPTASTDDDCDWITVAAQTPVRSLFHSDAIQLQIAENTTGQERRADVTIDYGGKQPKIFTVTQGTIDMSIVNDENGEVIVWEESFGLFASEDLTQQAKAEYKNVFTIEKSDDFSKGAYKLNGIFVYATQNGEKKGVYYADFSNNLLTIYKGKGTDTYPLVGDVTLTYDPSNKTFVSSEPFAMGYSWDNSDLKDGYIGNYNVKVYEEVQKPESGSFDVTTLYGEYTETFGGSWPVPGTTIIAASDKAGYDVKVTFFKAQYSSGETIYGKVNADGTKISFDAFTSNNFGPSNAFEITVDGNNLSGSYCGALAYTATKK